MKAESLKSGIRDDAEVFLRQMLERSGLLLEQGLRQYAFVHLSFLEYFTAQHLLRRINTALRRGDREFLTGLKALLRHRHWHETFHFLFQIIKQRRDQELHRDVVRALFGSGLEQGNGFDSENHVEKILLLELASDDYSWFDLRTEIGITYSEAIWRRFKLLDLSNQSLSDLAIIAPITQLEKLDLSGMAVTDGSLVHLANLVRLQILEMNSTPVTDEGLAHLATLRQLRIIDLCGTRVTEAGVAKLKAAIPHLTVFRT